MIQMTDILEDLTKKMEGHPPKKKQKRGRLGSRLR